MKSLGESIFSYRRSIIYSRSCRLQRCTTLPDYHVSQIRSCTRRCKNRCSNNRKKKKKKKNSFNVIRYNKSRKNRFHPRENKSTKRSKTGKKRRHSFKNLTLRIESLIVNKIRTISPYRDEERIGKRPRSWSGAPIKPRPLEATLRLYRRRGRRRR